MNTHFFFIPPRSINTNILYIINNEITNNIINNNKLLLYYNLHLYFLNA